MKKVFTLIFVGVLSICLCSCSSPKTVDKARRKADELVDKWDRKGKYTSGYMADFNSEAGMYFVTTYSLTAADETDFAKNAFARSNCEFIYNELSKVFKNVDVAVVAMMIDENQKVYYATINGNAINLEDLK